MIAEKHPQSKYIYEYTYNMSKILILSGSKPLPCCARCKKWGTDNCEDYPASFLCNNFDNDGTADSTHYEWSWRE